MIETSTDSWWPLMIGTGGDDAHAVDALHLRRAVPGRPTRDASSKLLFEKSTLKLEPCARRGLVRLAQIVTQCIEIVRIQ